MTADDGNEMEDELFLLYPFKNMLVNAHVSRLSVSRWTSYEELSV
jgi:hypothetical protein